MLKGLTMGERMTLQKAQENLHKELENLSPDVQKKIRVGYLTPLVWETLIEYLKRNKYYGYKCSYDEEFILVNKIRQPLYLGM